MKCRNCGKEIDKSWKFCRYCGVAVGNVMKTKHPETNKQSENKTRKTLGKRVWIIITACVLMTVIAAFGFFSPLLKDEAEKVPAYKKNESFTEKLDGNVEIELPSLDAKRYFEERSRIVSIIDAAKSSTVSTEKTVIEELSSRGFDTSLVFTDYAIDGSFCPDTQVFSDSSKKHPVYTTQYVSPKGEYWTIYEINGTIMAYPVLYNLQSTRGIKLIISETDTVISYDNYKNEFYESIPKASELLVKRIDRITAESLNKLTIEAIDAM